VGVLCRRAGGRAGQELAWLPIATLRREFAARARAIDPAQLSLLEALLDRGPPATIDPEAEARADAELAAEIKRAKQAQPTPPRKPRKPGPGWQTRGAARQEHHIEVPAAERTCADCGRVQTKIGADLTRAQYVPRTSWSTVPPDKYAWALQGGRDHGGPAKCWTAVPGCLRLRTRG
jgi:hypothetical protein